MMTLFPSPVRPQQIVYTVGRKQVNEYAVKEVCFNKNGGYFKIDIGNYKFDDIDKTVFTTELAAQLKLKEVQQYG